MYVLWHMQVIVFDLDTCAAEALNGDTIVSIRYNICVPLRYLIPDLLLTDLPARFKIDTSQFEFDPTVSTKFVKIVLIVKACVSAGCLYPAGPRSSRGSVQGSLQEGEGGSEAVPYLC